MKIRNVIFPALFLTLFSMPVFAAEMVTLTGTVLEDDTGDPALGANVIAYDSSGNRINSSSGTSALYDDGKFILKDIPSDSTIKVSYIGFETQSFSATEMPTSPIRLKVSASNMKEALVNASHNDGDPCSGKVLTDTDTNASAGEWKQIEGEWKCIPTDCILGYELKNDKCEKIICNPDDGLEFNGNTNQCDKVNCSKSELAALTNAKGGKWDGTKCIPTGCDNGWHLDKNKCVHDKCSAPEEDWDNKTEKCVKVKCTDAEVSEADENATAGKWDGTKCIPTNCKSDFKIDNGKCIRKGCDAKELEKLNATFGHIENGKCIPTECKTDYTLENGACKNQKILEDKQDTYDKAKEKEQSTANRMLGGLTTAATGMGGMQLAMGLAEKSADKAAEQDMAAYIATFRCNYGDGKQFKAGPDEIELPGGNNQEMMNLRGQYLALAADLKERKTALGMKPGIESEEILDKATSGLYDDESLGIESGNYASLYRAQALNSETDQKKLSDQQKEAKNRVIAGGVLASAGVAGGILGNSLINGKLGEKLKEKKQGKALRAAAEIEKDALDDMKKCLKDSGVKDTESLEFQNFYISVLSVKNINCRTEITQIAGVQPSTIAAKTIFADSNDANAVYDQLIKSFGSTIAGKMIGVTLSQNPTESQKQNAVNTLKSGLDKVTKRFQDAAKEDEKRLSASGLKDFDIDFSSILSSFSGDAASSSIMNVVNNGFK